ncbi:hypothetical protein ACLOJK_021920 [Asimina triloba]
MRERESLPLRRGYLLLLLAFSSSFPVTLSQCRKYPRIFNFGDSNSDTGGLVAGLGFSVNLPNGRSFFRRSTGRLCDGRLVIDFLSKLTTRFCIFPVLALCIQMTKLPPTVPLKVGLACDTCEVEDFYPYLSPARGGRFTKSEPHVIALPSYPSAVHNKQPITDEEIFIFALYALLRYNRLQLASETDSLVQDPSHHICTADVGWIRQKALPRGKKRQSVDEE